MSEDIPTSLSLPASQSAQPVSQVQVLPAAQAVQQVQAVQAPIQSMSEGPSQIDMSLTMDDRQYYCNKLNGIKTFNKAIIENIVCDERCVRFIRSCNIPCPPELIQRADEGLLGVFDTLRQRNSYICFGCSKSSTEPMPKHLGRELKNLARPVAVKVCTWLGVPDLTKLVKLKVPTKKSPGTGFLNMASPGQPIEFQPTKRPHLMPQPYLSNSPLQAQQRTYIARATGQPLVGNSDGDSQQEQAVQGQQPQQQQQMQQQQGSTPQQIALVTAGMPQMPAPMSISSTSQLRGMFEGVCASIEANTQAMHQSVEQYKAATLNEVHWLLNSLEAAGSLPGQSTQPNQSAASSDQNGAQSRSGPTGETAPQPSGNMMMESHDAARGMVSLSSQASHIVREHPPHSMGETHQQHGMNQQQPIQGSSLTQPHSMPEDQSQGQQMDIGHIQQ
eukprot:TRINITY_DN14313_c0_g1_i1.p1 TRINITY_DN14313_c0_g1~~TRINITY_DN14313_c0_g1_i1.p1  ORF type:complete len:445 (+),score=122.45 TRINITY_DN14313_c0_g1_i1:172-1506(+)